MIGLLCFVLAVLASPFKSKSRLKLRMRCEAGNLAVLDICISVIGPGLATGFPRPDSVVLECERDILAVDLRREQKVKAPCRGKPLASF
jgi:hypothetical protein